jgi:hypothetical protein
MVATRNIEGVTYYRFRARFRTTDGKRRSKIVWSPGEPWLRTEVARTLDAVFGIEAIKPYSCVIDGPLP